MPMPDIFSVMCLWVKVIFISTGEFIQHDQSKMNTVKELFIKNDFIIPEIVYVNTHENVNESCYNIYNDKVLRQFL